LITFKKLQNIMFAPLGGHDDLRYAAIYAIGRRKRHNSLRGLVIVAKIRLEFLQL
jgi:hypothetical protein